MKRLTLIFLIIIATIFLGEFSTRVYLIFSGRGGYIWLPDDYLGKIHAPNSKFTYKEDFSGEFIVQRWTNSFGLIGKEVSIKKPKGKFRILVLGDSFTEGLQVREGDNFCEQLEYLNKNFEVFNAGVAGFSPISEYLYLKRELLKFSPDAVILQLFSNDVFEDNKIAAMSVMDKDGLPVKINMFFRDKNFNPAKIETFYKIKNFLLRHSELFQSIIRSISKMNKKSSLQQEMIRKEEFNDHNQFFIIQEENHLFRNEVFRGNALENTQRYILAIRKLAQEKNIPFFLFLIPASAQCYIDKADFKPCLYFDRPPNTYFNEALKEFCLKENIPYLDLLTVFKQNLDDRLYFEKDFHLTALGHKLVAKSLSAFINENYEKSH